MNPKLARRKIRGMNNVRLLQIALVEVCMHKCGYHNAKVDQATAHAEALTLARMAYEDAKAHPPDGELSTTLDERRKNRASKAF